MLSWNEIGFNLASKKEKEKERLQSMPNILTSFEFLNFGYCELVYMGFIDLTKVGLRISFLLG